MGPRGSSAISTLRRAAMNFSLFSISPLMAFSAS